MIDFEGQEIEVLVSSADLKEMSMMVNCPGVAVDPSEARSAPGCRLGTSRR